VQVQRFRRTCAASADRRADWGDGVADDEVSDRRKPVRADFQGSNVRRGNTGPVEAVNRAREDFGGTFDGQSLER
jgi:hypothetical protein